MSKGIRRLVIRKLDNTHTHYVTASHSQHNMILFLSLNFITGMRLSFSWPCAPQQSRRGFICCLLAWIANRLFLSLLLSVFEYDRVCVAHPRMQCPKGCLQVSVTWVQAEGSENSRRTIHRNTNTHRIRLYPSLDLPVANMSKSAFYLNLRADAHNSFHYSWTGRLLYFHGYPINHLINKIF